MRRLAFIRIVLSALAICAVVAVSAPARAQQQGSIIDPDASVVNEQTLLREFPRIQGDTHAVFGGRRDAQRDRPDLDLTPKEIGDGRPPHRDTERA
jgi:hypothetical protein